MCDYNVTGMIIQTITKKSISKWITEMNAGVDSSSSEY